MVKVKICGITNLEDALLAASKGADALGFVFAPSPRQIEPEEAREICLSLPPFVLRVGVFVNEKKSKVKEIASYVSLDVLQFHGEESGNYCAHFKERVIKAFRVKGSKSLELLGKYKVDAFLLDAYDEKALGGTGKTFNWEIAREAKKLGVPIILSGGLNPSNVRKAIELTRPYAVDVSSGVEIKPGKKDPQKLEKFIEEVKAASL